jgi:hypothetical protein
MLTDIRSVMTIDNNDKKQTNKQDAQRSKTIR